MALYRGDLLAGLSVERGAVGGVARGERERLREPRRGGLAKLLAHQRQAGQLKAAIATAHRLLVLDRLQEPVHRTLMRCTRSSGSEVRRSGSTRSA